MDDTVTQADIAPDANDPGDQTLSEELKDLVHSASEDIVADEVDSEKEHE